MLLLANNITTVSTDGINCRLTSRYENPGGDRLVVIQKRAIITISERQLHVNNANINNIKKLLITCN